MAAKKPTAKDSNTWVGKVEEYSRKIWLAGLGVYSKIDTDGSKLFDTLVKDGEKAEKLAKDAGHKVAEGVKSSTSSARSRVEDVKDLALEKWGEFEEAFDKRLNSAISRLGVPSRNEVKALNDKVDSLTKQLTELRAFDDQLKHYADMKITLDLDDGVKVNYGKFGNLLAEVKAITGDKGE